jgi:dTDP-4-dehydrorhamnose reductase
MGRPEIWAGIECTINRLKSGYIDQLALSGHYDREDDIEAIAELGISTLRYPVLWEKHQPLKGQKIDFTWVSSRLNRLKELNIKPIAGLVHHGSGPEFTDLLDPKFPELLAAYAGKVAKEFPWIDMYTPVNEPLTTARFSGMYGLWYPHKKNDVSYVKMLLNQIKAVVLSMKAIRKVNPDAKLVQTEDLGKTYSTKLLEYQAKFENRRRWLTFDILCGKFTNEHPLWEYFERLGISAATMKFFTDNPCPPDLIGVNYYVTSERYLDQNLRNYPKRYRGGNTLHYYADVEAVRVKIDKPLGFKVLMKELWDRYKLPIAVTEAHLHCSREEQMKWFREIYNSSCELKEEGIDVRSVTAWSVLGAYGWNKLLTVHNGDYERGTFDVSSGKRRPTAMAGMIKKLVETGRYTSHFLNGEGWWKSDSRFFSNKNKLPQMDQLLNTSQPIVIIGKRGTLGKAFSRICHLRSLNHVLLSREDVDICSFEAVESIIHKYNPWAIVNAAGYVKVDDAENDKLKCFRENTSGPEQLATACRRYGIQFMTFSSDLVFDGKKNAPYFESDAVSPLNVYGESKANAEAVVSSVHPSSLIIRTSSFFGPWDQHNFVHQALHSLDEGIKFYASKNHIVSPTYVPHLVNAALDLLIDEEHGIWHLTNNEGLSWYDFALACASKAGMDKKYIIPDTRTLPATRPAYSVLQSEKGVLMPSLENAIEEYFSETLVLV